MTRRRTPSAGIYITLAMAAIIAWMVWSRSDDGVAPPGRGGRIVVSLPDAPRTLSPLEPHAATPLVTALTQGTLVRENPATLELEPWLAESWESSGDARTHTIRLRRGLLWSDGTPVTADDVIFTIDAILESAPEGAFAERLQGGGERMEASSPHPQTVIVRTPAALGGGMRALARVPILPRHRLEEAMKAGGLASAWPIADAGTFAGTGPFVLQRADASGLVFVRNPRYWRRDAEGIALPYLNEITVRIEPSREGAVARLEAGEIDLLGSTLPLENYRNARRADTEGTLALLDVGVAREVEAFWFCLSPGRLKPGATTGARLKPGSSYEVEFRRALSHAIDREEFAQEVFFGQAVPVWGAITPGDRVRFNPNVPRYPPDLARARELLAGLGIEDRNGDGVAEDTSGRPLRFTVVADDTDVSRRGSRVVVDAAAAIGIALDVQFLGPSAFASRIASCDYDAAYTRLVASELEGAVRTDFWRSSGELHVWNPRQDTPATEWEARIDELIDEMTSTADPLRRRELFDEAQRILGEHVPVVFLAAPRLYTAHHPRLLGVAPSPVAPHVLWNTDSLYVAPDERGAPDDGASS